MVKVDANVDNQIAIELLTEVFSLHNDSVGVCRCSIAAN